MTRPTGSGPPGPRPHRWRGDRHRRIEQLYADAPAGDLPKEILVPVEPDIHATRINDGRCDAEGRFVFGMFNQESGDRLGSAQLWPRSQTRLVPR